MRSYIISSQSVPEADFYKRAHEKLDAEGKPVLREDHLLGKPVVILPFAGTQKELLELIGYSSEEISVYPVKTYQVPDTKVKVRRMPRQ
jgi:hypothetical protein